VSEAEPRRVLVGTFVKGYSHVAVPQGSVEAAIAAAHAALDMEAEQRRRQAEALAADVARVKATRSARAARRFKRGLRLLLRGGIH
jgi:hypothetical protein